MKIPLEQCLYSFYHGVDYTEDDYSINLDLFEKEMEYNEEGLLHIKGY